MHNFEKRRDRYDLFASFDNPLVNLGFDMDVPDFRPYCKAQALPPFHFFLYCVLNSVTQIDNFMYRILDGEVVKIDEIWASYTVINREQNLNYAKFTMSSDLREFIARSLAAKQVAEASSRMLNTSEGQSALEQKKNIYITCMPWLKLTSIEHPIYRHKTYDVPSLAWGKFGTGDNGMLTVPFSVQAHHGFVDGYHVHLLAQAIAARIASIIS